MSLEYIRRTYKVPATRGTLVEYLSYDGTVKRGTITGSRGPYLRVRLDNKFQTSVSNFHPTYNIKYLPDGPIFGSDGTEPDLRTYAAEGGIKENQ